MASHYNIVEIIISKELANDEEMTFMYYAFLLKKRVGERIGSQYPYFSDINAINCAVLFNIIV